MNVIPVLILHFGWLLTRHIFTCNWRDAFFGDKIEHPKTHYICPKWV